LRFVIRTDEASALTNAQILAQCGIHIAALRLVHEFGCDTNGIQYQQGLKDTVPASDLVEGLLNNADRPPVCDEMGTLAKPEVPWPARSLVPVKVRAHGSERRAIDPDSGWLADLLGKESHRYLARSDQS
jgi:hypothetical protein